MIQDQEAPKYHKSKDSNVSKISKKSKHKHLYEECLIRYDYAFMKPTITCLRSYCTICGKIGERFNNDKSVVSDYIRKSTAFNRNYSSYISSDELYEQYKNRLPVFKLDNMFDDRVNLEHKEGMNL